jgi:hypothetical protein
MQMKELWLKKQLQKQEFRYLFWVKVFRMVDVFYFYNQETIHIHTYHQHQHTLVEGTRFIHSLWYDKLLNVWKLASLFSPTNYMSVLPLR